MSKTYEIKMPQLSDTMTEGVVVSWEKQIGDRVERGDIVATVETDKAIMDVEVFREGFLSGPIAAVDSTVPVGETIALIVADVDAVVSDVADASARPASSAPVETAAAPPEESVPAAAPVAAPEGVVFTIKMPQASDTLTEGVVASWGKAPGEAAARGPGQAAAGGRAVASEPLDGSPDNWTGVEEGQFLKLDNDGLTLAPFTLH